MSFNQKELLSLEPSELDAYLENGWFRMHQSVFTTDKIWFNNIIYPAIWLRVDLLNLQEDKTYKILKKKNKDFTIEITKAIINDSNEELFSMYKNSIDFEAAFNLQWLLYGYKDENVFDTKMISVYDEELLIGTGFFDLGENSAAGISSFYHPNYKRYSLGKYMIYEKMNYCKQLNLEYFYPGYVVPGYPAFDYKLSIAKQHIEYFDAANEKWIKLTDEL